MSIWQILGKLAMSDSGETLQRVSANTTVSSSGTVYTHTGNTTVGSDGSTFVQTGQMSSDGSVRTGSLSTGIGAVLGSRMDD